MKYDGHIHEVAHVCETLHIGIKYAINYSWPYTERRLVTGRTRIIEVNINLFTFSTDWPKSVILSVMVWECTLPKKSPAVLEYYVGWYFFII